MNLDFPWVGQVVSSPEVLRLNLSNVELLDAHESMIWRNPEIEDGPYPKSLAGS